MQILALVTDWKGIQKEVESTFDSFLDFFAIYKFGSFYTSRKSTALELALTYTAQIPDYEGLKFRSADGVTEIEVIAIV